MLKVNVSILVIHWW